MHLNEVVDNATLLERYRREISQLRHALAGTPVAGGLGGPDSREREHLLTEALRFVPLISGRQLAF